MSKEKIFSNSAQKFSLSLSLKHVLIFLMNFDQQKNMIGDFTVFSSRWGQLRMSGEDEGKKLILQTTLTMKHSEAI